MDLMSAKYAVFGQPIAHSKSPQIHEAFAAQRSQALKYERIAPNENEFESAVEAFFAEGGQGANVTLPFKERAYAMCKVRTERAEQAQAVNTLWMENGQLHGDNTDGAGLLADMIRNLNWKLINKRILVVGAGGAVRGILGCLLTAGAQEVVITNRTFERAEELAQQFNIRAVALDALAEETPFNIIINGTSASLAGESLALPLGILADSAYCYDMMYGEEPTPFMQWAQTQGAEVSDGLGMLVQQAAESFYRWHGWRPATVALLKDMRDASTETLS